MLHLMDFVMQIEQSRMSLTRTGQERLAQLAYSRQETDKKAKTEARKPLFENLTILVRCCPEATA